MSATGRSDCRHPDDFYETPAWTTRAILPLLASPSIAHVIDPACGNGAILDVIKDTWPHVETLGIELDADRCDHARHRHSATRRDALILDPWRVSDAVIMNPPFALAAEFIDRARREAPIVACLLRVNFLGSQKRAAFWRSNPCGVYILPRRPSFCVSAHCDAKCGWQAVYPIGADVPRACPKCGAKVKSSSSDATEYAWFVWGEGHANRWAVLDVEAS
jgi:predicted RNA methylase